MSDLQTIPVDFLDPNPHRRIYDYPFVPAKIEVLRRSIKDVGLWEGVIARPKGNRYEIAFGHHRIEAAKLELGEVADVTIVVRDLTNEEMLKFMGRENGEDYNADFMSLLETWEAAIEFRGSAAAAKSQPVEIAKLLGWLRTKKDNRKGRNTRPGMNVTAEACAEIHRLIASQYMGRSGFSGISVRLAHDVAAGVLKQLDQVDKHAQMDSNKSSVEDIEHAKRAIAQNGNDALDLFRKGVLTPTQAAHKAQYYIANRVRGAQAPRLLETFLEEMAKGLGKVLSKDKRSERIKELSTMLHEDEEIYGFNSAVSAQIDSVRHELDQLSKRAIRHRELLKPRDTPKTKQIGAGIPDRALMQK